MLLILKLTERKNIKTTDKYEIKSDKIHLKIKEHKIKHTYKKR